MEKRMLGTSGIEVTPIGMGCWAIGGPFQSGDRPLGWGKVDDNESLAALNTAFDLGITFYDTANIYGTGHSERLLATAFANKRSEVVIATKFGFVGDFANRLVTGVDFSPQSIREQCEASLKRLNTDYIDLYQLHINEMSRRHIADVFGTLDELVAEGKIRTYGWSTDEVKRAQAMAEQTNGSIIQHEMNVLRDCPKMLAVIEAHNLASINRGPLAMGLLTGKYDADSDTISEDDVRKQAPDWLLYFEDGKPTPALFAKLETIREILTSNGRTLAQGALAWLLARSPNTIPIPGFRTVSQVQDNVGALEHGPLTADQMSEIATLLTD